MLGLLLTERIKRGSGAGGPDMEVSGESRTDSKLTAYRAFKLAAQQNDEIAGMEALARFVKLAVFPGADYGPDEDPTNTARGV